MRVWAIDSEKEKVMQRNGVSHWKGSPRGRSQWSQTETEIGLCTGQVAKDPLSAGLGDVRTLSLPRGNTRVLREAGSAPTKETLVPTLSRDQKVQHGKNKSQHAGG